MINADRRGYIAGSNEATKYPQGMLPESEVKNIAYCVFTIFKQKGYAHIEPEGDFIAGFLNGFASYFLLSSL